MTHLINILFWSDKFCMEIAKFCWKFTIKLGYNVCKMPHGTFTVSEKIRPDTPSSCTGIQFPFGHSYSLTDFGENKLHVRRANFNTKETCVIYCASLL